MYVTHAKHTRHKSLVACIACVIDTAKVCWFAIVLVVAMDLTAASGLATVPAGYIDASTFDYNTTDATAALQAAIDTGSNVYVPNLGTDWNITPITLTHSNQEIRFESGVVIAAKSGAFQNVDDALFSATNQSNIKLTGYGATLKMQKSDYQQSPYTAGEWRHGINLLDVSGFEISGLTIRDTGGDAIYVGTQTQTGFSQDITIRDVRLDNNHRQGISIISVENMTIDNATILNTNGTAPEAGIDFEVNYQTQRIKNVQVSNTVIQANNTWGILFAGYADLTAGPISVAIDHVTILGNHADGIRMYEPLPQVTITDSLIVGNDGYGVRGTPVTNELILGEIEGTGSPRNLIEFSALWSNTDGAHTGWTKLGTGSMTNVEPIFYSLDPDSPYFLYLDPTTPTTILHGASDGNYIGARPMFTAIPEPGSVGLLAVSALWILRPSRHRHRI